MSGFDAALAAVMENEGGFTDNPADPGNWTGGAIDAGLCRGTKWGISAAAYPSLDIRNLTQQDARDIYLQRYWVPISGDRLPSSVALLLFDAAVNLGVGRAVKLLQSAVGAVQDGLLGPKTLAAVLAADAAKVGVEFQTSRLLFMLGLPAWRSFGHGWATRLIRLAFKAAILELH